MFSGNMCPNQEVGRSLLPDCHIANRVFMYSMLDYLHSGERRSEEVHAELRDRYEVFCQVLHNFPMPLHPEPEGEYDYECVFDALQQQQQQQELCQRPAYQTGIPVQASIFMETHRSTSSSSNLSESCEYYENALRSALAQLGSGLGMDLDIDMDLDMELDTDSNPDMDMDMGNEEPLLNSSDDVN